MRQEAQLSQRDRATLHVIEYFAKWLKITQGHSKWHCWVGRVCPCPLHDWDHPLFFWVFNFLPEPQRGKGHVGRRIWNLVWIRPWVAEISLRNHRNAKIDSYSNENFIFPFPPPGAAKPQKGRRHIQNQSMPACKVWRELARGLSRNRWQKKRTKRQTSASVKLTQTRHSHSK